MMLIPIISDCHEKLQRFLNFSIAYEYFKIKFFFFPFAQNMYFAFSGQQQQQHHKILDK